MLTDPGLNRVKLEHKLGTNYSILIIFYTLREKSYFYSVISQNVTDNLFLINSKNAGSGGIISSRLKNFEFQNFLKMGSLDPKLDWVEKNMHTLRIKNFSIYEVMINKRYSHPFSRKKFIPNSKEDAYPFFYFDTPAD